MEWIGPDVRVVILRRIMRVLIEAVVRIVDERGPKRARLIRMSCCCCWWCLYSVLVGRMSRPWLRRIIGWEVRRILPVWGWKWDVMAVVVIIVVVTASAFGVKTSPGSFIVDLSF